MTMMKPTVTFVEVEEWGDERDYEKEKMFPYEDELKRGRSVRYIRY